jgi:CRP/FNR family transcriptional regulator
MNTVDFMAMVPLFGELPPSARATIARNVRPCAVDAGQVLFMEGESCVGLHVLREGRVKGYLANAEGREQILRIFDHPGDAFCMTSAFSTGRYVVSASALTPSLVYVVNTAVLAGIAREVGAFALKLLQLAGGETVAVLKIAEGLALRTASGRLARVLHQLGSAEGRRCDGAVELDRSRLREEELAARIGAVRVHVSRSLRTLERLGVIRLSRRTVLIVDPLALGRLSEAPECVGPLDEPPARRPA